MNLKILGNIELLNTSFPYIINYLISMIMNYKRIISFVDDQIIGFDYPVRDACKILNEKGYITYWSSANKQDYVARKGHVTQNKSVAYILIDPKNLTDVLKEKLLLNGKCNFWGIALEHQDNGKYYGIWSEIPSLDTLCKDISNDLSLKALSMPILEDVKKR